MLFRRRRKNAEPAAEAVAGAAPEEPAAEAVAATAPAEPAAETVAAVAQGPVEEDARELMLSVMRAAPDLRYRAARQLGLLEGLEGASGPELERRLLERARDARALTALKEALAR